MIRLAADEYSRLLPGYLAEPTFFPLIAAVLERSQDGAVWVDDAVRPRQAYVEHRFGFAQIFGEPVAAFETDLEAYFSARRDFSVEKVRLYTPRIPAFLQAPRFFGYRSERQRFTLAPATNAARCNSGEERCHRRSGCRMPTKSRHVSVS